MPSSRYLITGGSQGIGAAVVALARKAGHQVVFTGRDDTLIADVAQKTGAHGLQADVTAADDNARTIDVCHERMGGIDVLVNNAAYAYRAEIGAIDVDRMRAMFETNIFGLVDITNRIVPEMKARAQGDIINIASTSGMKGAATATPYAASKWALRGGRAGRNNPNKLYAEDIGATIMAALNMPRRALWPELAVFANNPWKED
jgi:3-oxoacyl-[acyl-carrier protein] reductase